jgi:hypothetical protein
MQVQGYYGLEKLRQQAMPEIIKVADSQQMKDAMPNATFFERVQAYAKASHPRDTQNAMIIATTQAIKAANEEWANELLTNAPLRELKKKADAGDTAAIQQLKEKREALDRSQLDKIYSDPTGSTTRPTRADAIPADQRAAALAFIQANPNDPSVPALKASLGIR